MESSSGVLSEKFEKKILEKFQHMKLRKFLKDNLKNKSILGYIAKRTPGGNLQALPEKIVGGIYRRTGGLVEKNL